MNKNFSVPNPCHQKWDGMQPKKNGRYCGSCQKIVIDFTNKTDEEILDYIKDNSGKQLCGTFKNSQLPPPNEFKQYESSIRFLAALLLVFGMTLFSCSSVDLGDKPESDLEKYYQGDIMGLIIPPPIIETNKKRTNCLYSNGEIIVVDEEVICDPITGKPLLKQTLARTITGEVDYIKKKSEVERDTVLMIVDKMPEFPGGNSKMMEFISNNIKFPRECSEMGIQGTVYINFIVTKNGALDDIKILRGAHEALDKEALRVIKLMPNWTPGENHGKVVNVRCNLPIKFRL